MALLFDLYSLDGQFLWPAGLKVTSRSLNALTKMPGRKRLIRLRDTPIFADLKSSFEDKRYKTILSAPRGNIELLHHVRKVSFPEMIIEELLEIKRNMPDTYQHILRTAVLSISLSLDKQLKMTFDPISMARLSLVHDLGKSRIPFGILNKETPLTTGEYSTLKSHPLIGYVLLRYYCGKDHGLYDAATMEHHEKLDGSGYPRKIRKIKKYSQVIGVVDMLDALTSSRPYRKEPYTLRAALDCLLDEAKKGKLNRKIVHLLIAQARKSKPSLKILRVSREKRDAPPRENMYGKIIPGGSDKTKKVLRSPKQRSRD